jgi:hypothetical protein
MGLLNNLFGRSNGDVNWLDIKATDKVYPNHAIAVLMLKTRSGKPATGWLDKSYHQYEHKRFSPFNLLIKVTLHQQFAESAAATGMDAIQDFFITEVRRVSIAHMVARIVTDEGMNLEIYLEHKQPVIEHLDQLKDHPELYESFTYEINKDRKWTAVSRLMKL